MKGVEGCKSLTQCLKYSLTADPDLISICMVNKKNSVGIVVQLVVFTFFHDYASTYILAGEATGPEDSTYKEQIGGV